MGYERNDRRFGYGRDEYRTDNRYGRYGDPDERGFFDRAGDEIRSWFGDEEAERRRRMDERYDERYDGDAPRGRYGYAPGGYRSPDRYPSWARSNRDEAYRRPGYARGYTPSSYPYPAAGEDRQFETGYPDRFRIGSVGDSGYRYDHREDRDDQYRALYGGYGQDDEHGYHGWRNRQISALDRDYDEYRRENQSRFEHEFSSWRQNRQTQRDSLALVSEHMEVLGSDGAHVGQVDHVRGDRILLTKSDRDAGGHHHSIPSAWIATVDTKVQLGRTAEQAQTAWRDEEKNRGLFGRDRDEDRTTDLHRSVSRAD